jgi:hypothetical protein
MSRFDSCTLTSGIEVRIPNFDGQIMARFNKSTKGSTKTVNHEGAEAYKPSDKLELSLRTLSFMMSGDAFYTKEKDTSKAIEALVKKISTTDKEFVLRLAMYARNEMYLRTVPIFLAVEYAKAGTKLKGAYKWIPKILRRADEPAEALAYYYKSSGSRKIPALLKKGIAETLNGFDEYQLAKYNREGSVTLKDVLFLTHPKSKNPEQQKVFDKLAAGTLDTPFTWETHISAKGSTKEAWESVIPSMGYMAVLRNLRNFVEKGVDLTLPIDMLTDPFKVSRSKQFPYRFFSAYKELAYDSGGYAYSYGNIKANPPVKLLDAIQTAMELSVANLPKIPGKTFIASDNSGSMHSPVSEKSKVCNIDIASLFSAISLHICDDARVGAFGQTYKNIPLSKKSTILDNMKKIRDTDVGHSTNAWLALTNLYDSKEVVDRIFIFSDMQCYNSYGSSKADDVAYRLRQYRKDINPECKLYSFDLASYGLLKFPENDPLTCPMSGWSDNIFKFVQMFEEGRETLVKHISSYEM